jgi:hypothetical protein
MDFLRRGGNKCINDIILDLISTDDIPQSLVEGDSAASIDVVPHTGSASKKDGKKTDGTSVTQLKEKEKGSKKSASCSSNNSSSNCSSNNSSDVDSLLSLAVRVIAAAASHETYVTRCITFQDKDTALTIEKEKEKEKEQSSKDMSSPISLEKKSSSTGCGTPARNHQNGVSLLSSEGLFKFDRLCDLLTSSDTSTKSAALSLLMRILKSLPLSTTSLPPVPESTDEEKCKAMLELLGSESEVPGVNAPKVPKVKPIIPEGFLSEHSARMFLRALVSNLNEKNFPQDNVPNEKNPGDDGPDMHTSLLDALSAFTSESPDYYGKVDVDNTDIRLESLEFRRARQVRARVMKNRAKNHAKWAVSEGNDVA